MLKTGLNVIATNIYCGWRDCGIRGPAGNRAIRFANTSVPLANAWKYQEVPDRLIGPQLPWGSVHGMTLHHNGMVLPLGGHPFRGVVWYQGESDVHFGTPYYKATLPALMAEWRRQFGDPSLPFLIVQLPGYGAITTEPAAATWADLREAQRQAALADPHAAIAVTIDIGDPANLHPANKREVGRRLAIAARHLVYGERVPPSGPAVGSVTRRGARVIVTFRDVSGALSMRAAAVSGFELCGPTQVSCRWAEARLDGSSLVLKDEEGSATQCGTPGGSPSARCTTARVCPPARSKWQSARTQAAVSGETIRPERPRWGRWATVSANGPAPASRQRAAGYPPLCSRMPQSPSADR